MNSREQLLQDLMEVFLIDKRLAEDILAYAQTISSDDQEAIDITLAKELNMHVSKILETLSHALRREPFGIRKIDIQPLNRSYVLLTDELKKIYSRNEKLSQIKVDPIWEWLDILEGRTYELNSEDDWGNSSDLNKAHYAQVNKLNIIFGKEAFDYPEHIKKLLDESNIAADSYNKELVKVITKSRPVSTKQNRNWYIEEYSIAYRPDGTILINDALRLKKTHAGSASEKLMEQANRQPNVLFKPELGQTSRNLSTVISSMNFNPTLRALFFPTVSQDKGIIFRAKITHDIAEKERIDTYDLDTQLMELGIKTVDKPIDLSKIPF